MDHMINTPFFGGLIHADIIRGKCTTVISYNYLMQFMVHLNKRSAKACILQMFELDQLLISYSDVWFSKLKY